MTKIKQLLLSLSILSLTGCSFDYYYKKNEGYYINSIEDAAVIDKSEVINTLTAVKPENRNLKWKEINGEPYVLVVTWTSASVSNNYKNNATGFYETGNYPLFVTVAPDLINWYSQNNVQVPDIRLKQLLGLPMKSCKDNFVEFWVKPSDLIRPCPDPEVNDNTCNLLSEATMTNAEYQAWLKKYREDSFINTDKLKNYPFTMLGYTYDWNKKNKNHVGLSEFVVPKNKLVVVNSIKNTAEYLNAKQP